MDENDESKNGERDQKWWNDSEIEELVDSRHTVVKTTTASRRL
jgi:hypothetical protein